MQGRACVKALCIARELKAKGRDCLCLQTSPPELGSRWCALPRTPQLRQMLGITAVIAVFIIPDTTAMRQTFLREVSDFPPNERTLVKLPSRGAPSSPRYFHCRFQQQGGSAEPRSALGRAGAAPGLLPLPYVLLRAPLKEALSSGSPTQHPRDCSASAAPFERPGSALHPPGLCRTPFYQTVRRVPSLPG